MARKVSEGNTGPESYTADATAAFAGTEEERRERASEPILSALRKADDEFRDWDATCQLIDDIYSKHGASYENLASTYGGMAWRDSEMDLFWSSYEILKPAVYARPPRPAVKPLFSDATPSKVLTAEILERATTSAFARSGIDDVMIEVRNDLIFTGRGVPWLRYEVDDGKQVCVEHLDRTDFRHEPARKWAEVGWVAGGFWLTRAEMSKRFDKLTDEQLDNAKFTAKRARNDDRETLTPKCRVWEVWHRADNKVYWVTEGIDVRLDESAPHLKLSGFFPCPRPAYATLRRRSLVPVPDWERYAGHFSKINTLTGRIYLLLDQVKMKGLIAAGGDVGDAVEQLIAADDDQILVPVPGAAMMATGGAANIVAWLPLADVATAIQGLIQARAQLIDDFYQLSGISDIMRGATEAEETLGAQQLKSQYGSVRVRCKIDELQRVAADMVKIAAEIISEKFDEKTILEMAQMDVPTKRELEKRVREIEEAAEKELKALSKRAQEAAQQAQEPVDPAQAQQMLQQAQQQVLAKYAPMLEEVQNRVPIDDVMDLLRDDRARSFAFEVESDSTILVDEQAEKASRNEFMGAFTQATQSLMQIAGLGEAGGKLAGELMKFVLAPYRAGRQLDSAIDAFIDAAPQMAAASQGEGDGGLAAAQAKLAEAEMEKAKAAMAKVEADGVLRQAENQRKMIEMQQKSADNERKFAAQVEGLRQAAEANAVKAEEAMAKVDLIRAQTMKALAEAGVVVDSQNLDEFKSLKDIEFRERDQAMAAQTAATDTAFRAADQARQGQRDSVDDDFRARGEERADAQFAREPGE